MSHVERTSKYTKLAKLPDKNADFVVQACARVLLPLADQIETITYDNGKEFASHAQIATSLGALSYFAKPYHSWERGLNEHTNGLFRQYFPKGSDFSILSDADVQRVEDKLNSRPKRYSATKPLARFSSAPEICPLHFTVEWASIKTGSPVFFQNGACWPGSCIKLEHTNFRQISGVNQPSKVLTSARSNRLNAATWLAPHRMFS